MGTLIRRLLAEPRLAGVDVDRPDLVDVHRRILATKPLTRAVFSELYRECRAADERCLTGDGLRVEIGAGSSFLKELYPDVLTTDIKDAPGIERIVDAMAMPFGDGSVRAVYAIHAFHHLSDPAAFLKELERVLQPGGGCILVEPYYGPLASFMFRRIFTTEGFDPHQRSWQTPTSGPMAGANQALSYVVLVRDAREVARRFTDLEIVERRPLRNWLRYTLSGGVNFRTLAPGWADPVLGAVEWVLSPLARWLAIHQLIVLRRASALPR